MVSPTSLADACSLFNGLKDPFPLHIQCKLNDKVKNDDVTLSGRRDLKLHKRLRAVLGRMRSIRFWYVDLKRGFLTLLFCCSLQNQQ